MAIDYTSAKGQVRLLITDVSEVEADQIFTDDQLDAFLAMAGENVNRASAKALTTMAASEVLTSKVIRTQDLATDGAKVSAELRALAKTLMDDADADEAGFFDVTPMGYPCPPEGAEAHW